MTRPQEAEQTADPAARLAVRVMTVQAAPLQATATGYGRVAAVRSWTAVSEVDGRVIDLHDDLAEGTIVDTDELMVEVDGTDYELAIQKSKANIAAAEASLAELDRQEANSKRLLEVEQRILDVARTEFDRVQDLVDRGTSTRASLDTAERTLLAQETSVTNLLNTLELYPAQRESAQANLAVRQAELAEAERSLSKTVIRAPFRGRVASAAVEVGQFIRTGEQLLSVDDTAAVEVVAEFPMGSFAPMAQMALGQTQPTAATLDAARVLEYLAEAGVRASVELELGELTARYPARLARFRGTIDSETGAIGVAVQVDDPLMIDGAAPRPPLNVGTFVGVELKSPPADALIAVPRAALHQDDEGAPFVYLADADDRLKIQPVSAGLTIDDRVVIQKGLTEGDRLILSAPRPPIDGLPLAPVDVGR